MRFQTYAVVAISIDNWQREKVIERNRLQYIDQSEGKRIKLSAKSVTALEEGGKMDTDPAQPDWLLNATLSLSLSFSVSTYRYHLVITPSKPKLITDPIRQ